MGVPVPVAEGWGELGFARGYLLKGSMGAKARCAAPPALLIPPLPAAAINPPTASGRSTIFIL
eukprot:CAMPEP_0175030022 /NCGR_PEP_ID=MMETSP0005-20121125/19961_1 /TAXON_ID=420556 /ORGANISM="Ochromonas sp., Strain CCMP1393" /LENGTH=62 /DNA_ID=CAMNT_0016289979 /DNA_START=82 /DNA_END=267 /DNA_ORIENTATION=+